MKRLQYVAIILLVGVILVLLVLIRTEVSTEAKAPEVNTEGLCWPIKVDAAEIIVDADENKVTAYTEADIIALAQMLYGEVRGCTMLNQQQCVWCVLNRVDDARFPDSIIGVVSQPGQFYGYSAGFPVWDELYAVALDVVQRWAAEKQGEEVARELGSDYLWFTGDGQKNVFRAVY